MRKRSLMHPAPCTCGYWMCVVPLLLPLCSLVCTVVRAVLAVAWPEWCDIVWHARRFQSYNRVRQRVGTGRTGSYRTSHGHGIGNFFGNLQLRQKASNVMTGLWHEWWEIQKSDIVNTQAYSRDNFYMLLRAIIILSSTTTHYHTASWAHQWKVLYCLCSCKMSTKSVINVSNTKSSIDGNPASTEWQRGALNGVADSRWEKHDQVFLDQWRHRIQIQQWSLLYKTSLILHYFLPLDHTPLSAIDRAKGSWSPTAALMLLLDVDSIRQLELPTLVWLLMYQTQAPTDLESQLRNWWPMPRP